LRGQWIGKYEGSTGGEIILNVDELEEGYLGVAYLLPDDKSLPRVAASFKTPNKNSPFRLRTREIYAFEPSGVTPLAWNDVKKYFPADMTFSSYADVKGEWDDKTLTLDWKSDLDAVGHSVLPRSRAGEPSEMKAQQMGWSQFKNHLENLKTHALIFRGQSAPWRLRTRFHRTGRSNLYRYVSEDIGQLHRNLSARTRHLFDLSRPDEFGSFCSLVQHHGYPTPMLDWSRSPYVAAFFAYRTVTHEDLKKAEPNAKVRIHVFEYVRWKETFVQLPQMLFPGPHVSILEFVAMENERLIPQQGVSTVTNIDDIETYIRTREREREEVYLSAYDLPINERNRAMSELGYMGITAGSLFPGLDGACEELRERNFDF
jgi:hypothetical protein